MDLLWQGNVEAFALVSSDSDFTRLATRLRESGKRVYGLGMRKTPESLRRAVDQFIYLELLQDQAGEEAGADGPEEAPARPDATEDTPDTTIHLQSALTKAINATSDDDGWADLGPLGQHLSRAHADFDPRAFGHQKLSTLVEEQPYLETRRVASTIQVRIRTRQRTGETTAKRTTAKKTTAKKAEAKKSSARTTSTKQSASKQSAADTDPAGRESAASKGGTRRSGSSA